MFMVLDSSAMIRCSKGAQRGATRGEWGEGRGTMGREGERRYGCDGVV